MISKQQLILIHTAKRDIARLHPEFDDAQYRITLRSIAGVESSKDLDNRTFEQVMGFFESLGYHQPGSAPGYWTAKADRTTRNQISDREIRRIEQLAAQQPYSLEGLIHRITNHRTSDLVQLTSGEAYKLQEALKGIVDRSPAAKPATPRSVPTLTTAQEQIQEPGEAQ